MRITELRTVVAFSALLALAACSRESSEPPTAVQSSAAATHVIAQDPWARPTPPVATVGAAYVTITNHGTEPDRLLSASTPVAARVELHESIMTDGMAQMREIGVLEVAPHQTASMKPGGMHLMLLDLVTPLAAGSRFPLTLNFESAGAITIDVLVIDGPVKRADAG